MNLFKFRDEKLEEFLALRNPNPVLFKKGVIDFYARKKEYISLIASTSINGKILNECELFSSKKEMSLSFWKEVLKNNNSVNLTFTNVPTVPSAVLAVSENLFEIGDKNNYDISELVLIRNHYSAMYEAIQNLIVPFFEDLKKEEKKEIIYWSDIAKKIDKKYKKTLFRSMNGKLRNAITHGSFMINGEKFIWIKEEEKEDGSEYPAKKVIDKTIDLFYLIWVLHWGLNEVIVEENIKKLRSVSPIELSKNYEIKFKEIERKLAKKQNNSL